MAGSRRTDSALGVLEGFAEEGRASTIRYSPREFELRWRNADRNGCDSRNDILWCDLRDIKTEPRKRTRSDRACNRCCLVMIGVLINSYSGYRSGFVRAQGPSNLVHIAKVVAKENALSINAFQWTDEKRKRFANDP